MIRKRMLAWLTLGVFGVSALQCAAAPLPTHPAPPIAQLVQGHDDLHLTSAVVHDFSVYAPVGKDVLDHRAEVMFDS
jgi:hypothetical protein